ncbi:MAG: creatininase family protein [Anaerolineae bacterium]
MQWEQMTAPELGRAARELGVCVIAMGVLERHSDHLPLGTDYLNAHRIASLAAEKEPAVVFPPWYFGQIYEARAFPGAVTLKPTLLLELMQGIFDEIGRNGFRKIIIFNGHGGNTHFINFLAQCSLWEQKPYTLYAPSMRLTPEREERWKAIRETTEDGHAGEQETSVSLANHPHLVRTDQIPEEPGHALGRLKALGDAFLGIKWYSNYPEHYAGDGRYGSKEKGEILVGMAVDTLAEFIAAVKADQVTPGLEDQFFRRERSLRD